MEMCCIFATLAIPAWSTSNTIPAAQDFGQVQANGAGSGPISLTYLFPGLNAIPTFSVTYGVDFKLSTPACTGTTDVSCSVPVSFRPLYPGSRLDAIVIRDSRGNLLGKTLLRGIGEAPETAIYPGTITTYAGTGSWSYLGDGQQAISASFRNPQGLAIDTVGNIYVADSLNHVVREISASTGMVNTIAGTPLTAGYSGDGGQATQAQLNTPTAVVVDGAGDLYIADQGNNRIRKVDGATGVITTVAGGGQTASGSDGLGDGGRATGAILSGPADAIIDGSGNLYIADAFHGLIRKVDASSGTITVVAGGGNANGSDGFGDGGPATQATLDNPMGIGMDAAGNLYIADTGHNMVRFVSATSGLIDVIAGTGRSGYGGDLGVAVNALLCKPSAVRADAAANVYIADSGNNVIRQVQAASGIIQTIAGTGAAAYYGDGDIATRANLANPAGLALDTFGGVYIADTTNNAVRKVTFQIPQMIFGGTKIGQASSSQFLIVENIGNRVLDFNAIGVSSNFQQQISNQLDCTTSSVVAAGSNCRITVAFVPTASGSSSGSVTVTTNSLNAPLSIEIAQLLGTAISGSVPASTLSASNLAFGNQNIGNGNAAQIVTLSNKGAGALQLAGIWLTGADMGDFGIATTCMSVIEAGTSCSVSITFAPTSAGSRSASLIVADWLNGMRTVALSGTASVQTQAPQPQRRKADFTVWRPANGTWFVNPVSGTGAVVQQWGLPGDIPVPGDYDGDGKTDFAVWRPVNGTWFVLFDGATNTYPNPNLQQQWGLPGDIPVPGDYDGDGKTDFAVWRPAKGTWFIIPSSNPKTAIAQQWGLPGDVPIPKDFNLDGKSDLGIWRPSNGSWYVLTLDTVKSYPTPTIFQQWGLRGDIPL